MSRTIKRTIARLLVAIARACRLEVPHTERAYPHTEWWRCFNGAPGYRLTDRVCAECGEPLTHYSPLSRCFPEAGLLSVCQVCAMFTTRGPEFVPSIHDRSPSP